MEKPRLLVLTDIGNEPDDQMSMVRLLVYANQFEIEGLVATTSTWQKRAVKPEILHELSRLYALRAGDLVFMGTPAGVAALQPGDRYHAVLEGVAELHGHIAPATV